MHEQDENKNLNYNPNEKSSGESSDQTGNTSSEKNSSLNELVRQEQFIAHDRVEEELGREPSQEETNQWLNEHTEGY